MAKIKATCPKCGDVDLQSRDLTIRTCIEVWCSEYIFRCPKCRFVQIKPATEMVVEILLAAGVRSVEWTLPAELNERPSNLPDITVDDFIDWHQMLEKDDFSLDEIS